MDIVFVMRVVRNLAFFCIGLALGGMSAYSFASTSAPVKTWHYPWGSGAFPSVAAVCAADIALPEWSGNWPGCSFACQNIVQGDMSGSYTVHATCNNGGQSDTGRTSNATMACPSGFRLQGSLCVSDDTPDPCASKKGQYFSGSAGPMSDPSSVSSFVTVCAGGCRADLANAAPKVDPGSHLIYLVGSWQFSGASCVAGDPPGNPSNSTNPSDSTPDPNTKDNPDTKDQDQISKSCTDNAGGGHTTKYTITHADGSVDYQYVTLAGKCNGANDSPDATDDFCKNNPTAPKCANKCADNPSSPECKDRNSNGGDTCDSPPTCDGDAIDCAVLKQDWLIRCEAVNEIKKDGQYTDGKSILAGNDPKKGEYADPKNPTAVALPQLQSGEMFSSSCPPPVTATVYGKTLTWDLSPFCTMAEIFGYINVLLASIGAAYILQGSFS